VQDVNHAQRRLRRGALAGAVVVLLSGCGGGGAKTPATAASIHHTGRLGTQGSLGGVPVPFAHQQFHVTNMYLGRRGKYSVDVYAGYPPGETTQGQLRVTWIDNTVGLADDARSGTFTPQPTCGPLWLTAVHGDTVSLRCTGRRGTFDLRTHRFELS
jgi:hypothetical protein